VAIQVMLSNKTFATSFALVLSISEMCLDMRVNVFSSTENLAATLSKARPFVRFSTLFADVFLDFLRRDTGKFHTCVDPEVIESRRIVV
jgi:hypothetical protein